MAVGSELTPEPAWSSLRGAACPPSLAQLEALFRELLGWDFALTVLTFDSVQSAQRAKASLNGADIYSGCCTLKIEYAKVGLGNGCRLSAS